MPSAEKLSSGASNLQATPAVKGRKSKNTGWASLEKHSSTNPHHPRRDASLAITPR
jgi:hypothetical protein